MARIFTSIDSAEEAYENLKNKIIQGKANTGEAISLLNQIINDLPNTWIANLAKELLKELEQYMKVLVLFRNVCAHNECLFSFKAYSEIPNTLLHKKLNISTTGGHYDKGKSDLFAVFIAVRYLLYKDDFKELKKRFLILVREYTRRSKRVTEEQILEYMGFPTNWKTISLYRNI